MTTIAIDAMGGDFAPVEVVKGALTVAREDQETILFLVGDEALVSQELAAYGAVPGSIRILHAAETIGMHEHPAQAVRRKRQSSLVLCGQMVKRGEAQGTFSAGNTGAAMAIASLEIGRIAGVDRPAIATLMPTRQGRCLLLDAGANVDSTPQNLLQWALIGSIYAEKFLKIHSPKVGLLNIGSEAGKGNELTKAAYILLQASTLNFVGNVEGKDVFEHGADVVVCDGFAGNILLKGGEGVAELILSLLQQSLMSTSAASEILPVVKPILGSLMQRIDYSETGGAPLLGINGVSFIGHGRSHAKAIASGIRAARDASQSGYVKAIRDALAQPGCPA